MTAARSTDIRNTRPVVASPRLRTVVRWVGAAFTIATLTAGFFKLLTTFAFDQNTTSATYTTAQLAAVDEVSIQNTAGDVVVRGGPSSDATVTSDVADGLFRAREWNRVDGDQLTVRGSCPMGFATRCHVHHALDVPAGLDLEVSGQLGTVDVSGMTGALRLGGQFGRMSIDGATGPVRIEHGFGELVASGLASPVVEVSHQFGDTTLTFSEPPTNVQITTQFGTTLVEVPDDGAPYRIRGATQLGNRSVEVRTDPASDRVIHIDTQFGDATIRYAR